MGAANLETKVSRSLQELAVTHSSVMVPAHIEQRVLQKAADFTSEEAVSKCMQGMGRDSIVAHQALVAEAQRRMRRLLIESAPLRNQSTNSAAQWRNTSI